MTSPTPPVSDDAPAVGVDIGGTKIAAGLVTATGTVLEGRRVATPATLGRDAVLDAVVGVVQDLLDTARRQHLATPTHVGIGSAGVIDPATGDVVAATDHIAGWAGTPLARAVGQRTGLPTCALNDVHAHAVGEAMFGAGAGLASMLLVAAGTGLGGSFVLDGRPWLGSRGVAGHFGHMPAPEAQGMPCACGGIGHLESVACGGALPELYRHAAPGVRGPTATTASAPLRSGVAVVAAAHADDPAALAAVELTASALGRAIGGWVNAFDPDAVVVTGGLTLAGEPWWDTLRDAAAEAAIPAARTCPILPAALGERAALVGAASYRPAHWHTR